MTDWNKWLKKRELCADNILYVYRRDRKTIIHREDGEEFELFAPVYTLLALFTEDAFLNINKGIAVNKARIVDISSEGVYTMSDGQTFQGRKRNLSAHRQLRKEMGINALPDVQPQAVPLTLYNVFRLIKVTYNPY